MKSECNSNTNAMKSIATEGNVKVEIVEPITITSTITPIKSSQDSSSNKVNYSYNNGNGTRDGVKSDISPATVHSGGNIEDITSFIQDNKEQLEKVANVMENMYETVRNRDANIALKEGLLLPIAGDKGEKHYVITKIINKKSKEDKTSRMDLLIESLFRYCYVDDSVRHGYAAREIFESDVVMLYLKEVEDDEDEPFYICFGSDKDLKLAKNPEEEDGEEKFNCACTSCRSQEACDEFIFGSYCVAAVKRYFDENKYHSKVKCAYQVYVAHYNRVLDYHSFDENYENRGMRHTEITRPPLCMKNGSLKYALFWIKWQIENGPLKEHYTEERRKRKRQAMTKKAKLEANNKYRYRYFEK